MKKSSAEAHDEEGWDDGEGVCGRKCWYSHCLRLQLLKMGKQEIGGDFSSPIPCYFMKK